MSKILYYNKLFIVAIHSFIPVGIFGKQEIFGNLFLIGESLEIDLFDLKPGKRHIVYFHQVALSQVLYQ